MRNDLRRLAALPTLALLAVALPIVLAACESAPAYDPAEVQLVAELRDYRVDLNAAVLKAGAQRIGIRNTAGQVHDLVVIRTDLAPDQLPVDAGRAAAREDGAVGKIKPLRSGGTARLDVTLEPGWYVVICNTPGHYRLGMRTGFSVE